MTWAIPWSPGSLPLWPRVPVTALKPLQAPVLLSQFQSRPLLHGKVGSMPASLLGQKTPTGLPQGPWDPGIHTPQSSPLCHSQPHPSPEHILRVAPSQGSIRCLLFQLLSLKRARSSVQFHPLPGYPESLHIITRHRILVHFQSLLSSLEVANWELRVGLGLPR